MSEYEINTGTLHKIGNNDYKESCEALFGKLPNKFECREEFILEEYYNKFAILGNSLYSIDNERSEDFEVFKMSRDNDNLVYNCSFYDGGTCLHEALEIAYRNMTEDGGDN